MIEYQVISRKIENEKRLVVLFFFSFLLCFIRQTSLIACIVSILIIAYFLIEYDIEKTKFDYFLFLIGRLKLERQLMNAKIYVRLNSRKTGNIYVKLPKIHILRQSEFKIWIQIELAIDNYNILKEFDFSPIFKGYRQMRVLDTIGRESIIFELEKVDYDRQFKFRNIREIVEQNWDVSKISIDKNTEINTLNHILLSGQTGSGKTYALLYLLLILAVRNAEISVCDPKNSDLAELSKKLKMESKTSATDIVKEVKNVYLEMEKRKKQRIKENWPISTTAIDNGLNLRILVVDEFASLQLKLQKKELDELLKYIYQIILEGRALSCFVILGMQQANATVIPTSLREQFGSIFVLGNSGEQTFNVAFQEKADNLPKFPLKAGEGWLVQNTDIEPKFVRFPFLEFLI